jgi:hypothetical protein
MLWTIKMMPKNESILMFALIECKSFGSMPLRMRKAALLA